MCNRIKSTLHLEFEELSAENYPMLEKIFREDSNAFIPEEYRKLEKIENYYNAYKYFNNLSSQTANYDWFFKLKSTGEYIGLLNLYDLMFNKESEYHKICSIGFATGERYRRKGLTKEAVQALIDYTFTQLNLECITASTENENIASCSLLQSLGFKINTKDHNDDLKHKYFELRKP